MHHHIHRQLLPISTAPPPPPPSSFFTCLSSLYNYTQFTNNYTQNYSTILRFNRLFPLFSNPSKWSTRCRATSPGPPSPPELDPPPGDNPSSSSGIISTFSRVQDTVRIFFAVLFWMSLFFWSCVWDGRNDGRPKNRSRFRR